MRTVLTVGHFGPFLLLAKGFAACNLIKMQECNVFVISS